MRTSENVDILSISLWTNWMGVDAVRDNLLAGARDGHQIRILLYKPGSTIQTERAELEGDTDGQMEVEINQTAAAIRRINERVRNESGAPRAREIELRYTTKAHHAIHMVNCDDAMLVSFYLTNVDGTHAPTIQVRPESRLFESYSRQFDQLFRLGLPPG